MSNASPSQTLLHALDRFERESRPTRSRLAVDLGCGDGSDSTELLRRGWHVIAIDREQAAIDALLSMSDLRRRRLHTRVQTLEQSTWPSVDLVNARLSLLLCDRLLLPVVWQRILVSLRPSGRFAGYMLGERDHRATGQFGLTRARVNALFQELDLEFLQELEQDGYTVTEAHHVHIFAVVARRL